MNQKEKPRFAKKQDSVYCQESGVKRQEEKWFFSEQSERGFSIEDIAARKGGGIGCAIVWKLVYKQEHNKPHRELCQELQYLQWGFLGFCLNQFSIVNSQFSII